MTISPGDPSDDGTSDSLAQQLFQQEVDLPDGGSFSIQGLLDSLEAHTATMLQEAANAQAALAAAGGEGQHGIVRVRVDAGGRLTGLSFDEALSETSTASLNRQLMLAHRLAVRAANRQVAAWTPAFSDLITGAAPSVDDESAARDERPSDPEPAPAAPPLPLPADPQFDAWLSALDDLADGEDFGAAVQRMKQTAPFEVPDLTGLTGPQVDEMFRLDNERTAARINALQTELQAITGTASLPELDLTVNAGGAPVAIEFRAAAVRLTPDELAALVLTAQSTAATDADARTRELLRSSGLDDEANLLHAGTHPTTTEQE
ncbi:YbaB/EbfC family nucleoid-associated protein [Aestuariimicrobium soli]|uniref:YbaB/EbfC family nucleoid-associated protein n=1 Tax=Aestuariimicrobium soli TaxID=2035834 RepID=UPI003EB6B91B